MGAEVLLGHPLMFYQPALGVAPEAPGAVDVAARVAPLDEHALAVTTLQWYLQPQSARPSHRGASPSVHMMGSLDAPPSMARVHIPWVTSGTVHVQTLPPRLRGPETIAPTCAVFRQVNLSRMVIIL